MFITILLAVAMLSALVSVLSRGLRDGRIETPIGFIERVRRPALFYACITLLVLIGIEYAASAALAVYVRTSATVSAFTSAYVRYELVVTTANVLLLMSWVVLPTLFTGLTKGEVRTQLGLHQWRRKPLPFLFWISFFAAILLLAGLAFYAAVEYSDVPKV